MSESTLYAAHIGGSRLTITARPGAYDDDPVWLVEVCRWGRSGKTLDRTAAWLPQVDYWDEARWFPSNPRQVPPAALAAAEAWLRGRAVGEVG